MGGGAEDIGKDYEITDRHVFRKYSGLSLDELAELLKTVEGREKLLVAHFLCENGDPRGPDVLWSFYRDCPLSVVGGLVCFIETCGDGDLKRYADKIFTWFVEALKNTWSEVREATVNGLYCINLRSPEYRKRVLEILDKVALEDDYRYVRVHALAYTAVIKYGCEKVERVLALISKFYSEENIRGLVEFLDSDEPYFRQEAA